MMLINGAPKLRPFRIFFGSFAVLSVLLVALGAMSPYLSAVEAHAESSAAPLEVATVETVAMDVVPVLQQGADQTTVVQLRHAGESTPWTLRLYSFFGILGFLLLAVAMSTNRRNIRWRTVAVGLGLQALLGLFIHRTIIGEKLFSFLGNGVTTLLGFSAEGTRMLFGSFAANGEMMPALLSMAFVVFPSIIFFSSLMAIFYHLGVMQRVVGVIAYVMRRTMGTSGPESLSAAANIFVGQIEAPLMIRPYVGGMTHSELMAVMTGGFATVAGGVMASYVGFLQPAIPEIAHHLLAASVMAAPGALVIAKIMVPESEDVSLRDDASILEERPSSNVIDAAATGSIDGMNLAMMVGAILLAFVGLVALLNYALALPSFLQHGAALQEVWTGLSRVGIAVPDTLAYCDPSLVRLASRGECVIALAELSPASSSYFLAPVLSMQNILGVLFWPVGAMSGVPLSEARHLAELYGQKFALNEFLAYLLLLEKVQDPTIQLSSRTIVMASYGLCGFANLSSIAVQIGGIGSIVPERRSELAKIGMRAMIAGSMTSWMCACIAGVLL